MIYCINMDRCPSDLRYHLIVTMKEYLANPNLPHCELAQQPNWVELKEIYEGYISRVICRVKSVTDGSNRIVKDGIYEGLYCALDKSFSEDLDRFLFSELKCIYGKFTEFVISTLFNGTLVLIEIID